MTSTLTAADMAAFRDRCADWSDFAASVCEYYESRGRLTARQEAAVISMMRKLNVPIEADAENSRILPPESICTPHQKVRLDQVMGAIRGGAKVLALSGPAGTGKTHMIQQIAYDLQSAGRLPVITATTHQAAAVLRTKKLPAATIHSACGLRPKNDGSQGYDRSGRATMPDDAVLIMDEASMADFALIKAATGTVPRGCLLLVGDHAQLKPVAGGPMFTEALADVDAPVAVLEEVLRAEHPEILEAGLRYRPEIWDGRKVWPEPDGEFIDRISVDEAKARFLVGAPEPKALLIVAYTNRVVQDINRLGRRNQFGDRADREPYIEGELVIANSMVEASGQIIVNNGQMGRVLAVRPGDRLGEYWVKLRLEGPAPSQDPVVEVFAPIGQARETALEAREAAAKAAHADLIDTIYDLIQADDPEVQPALSQLLAIFERSKDIKDLREIISSLEVDRELAAVIEGLDTRRRQAWGAFYDAKNGMADLRATWARTVHKSQGSTTRHVVIFTDDIDRSHEDWRPLAYVALTRAKARITLVG